MCDVIGPISSGYVPFRPDEKWLNNSVPLGRFGDRSAFFEDSKSDIFAACYNSHERIIISTTEKILARESIPRLMKQNFTKRALSHLS